MNPYYSIKLFFFYKKDKKAEALHAITQIVQKGILVSNPELIDCAQKWIEGEPNGPCYILQNVGIEVVGTIHYPDIKASGDLRKAIETYNLEHFSQIVEEKRIDDRIEKEIIFPR